MTTDLHSAHASVLDWWSEHHMLDGLDSVALTGSLTDLRHVADRLEIRTLDELTARATDVIRHVTGLDANHFASAADTASKHGVRNIIACLTFANRRDARAPYSSIANLPTIKAACGASRRPLRGDEVLLMRSGATHAMDLGRRARIPAVQHALTESGAIPSESTTIRPIDFDDKDRPTQFTVHEAGYSGLTRAQLADAVNGTQTSRRPDHKRTIHLDPWAAGLLTRALREHSRDDDEALGYTGSAGGYAASASVSGNLSRAMDRVGIHGIEPTGITRWRVKRELVENCEKAALQLLGWYEPPANSCVEVLNTTRLYEFLDYTPPIQTHTIAGGRRPEIVGR